MRNRSKSAVGMLRKTARSKSPYENVIYCRQHNYSQVWSATRARGSHESTTGSASVYALFCYKLKVCLKNNVHYTIKTVVKLMLRVNFFKIGQLNCDKMKCLNTKSNFKSYLHRKQFILVCTQSVHKLLCNKFVFYGQSRKFNEVPKQDFTDEY